MFSFSKTGDNIFHFNIHDVIIFCLLSALGRGVGTLQISIIIIIIIRKSV